VRSVFPTVVFVGGSKLATATAYCSKAILRDESMNDIHVALFLVYWKNKSNTLMSQKCNIKYRAYLI